MPEQALTKLGESTTQAICGVLELFCPGQVHPGEVAVLAPRAEPLADFPAPFVATTISYVDGVTGGNVLVMTLKGAKRLAAAMMGTGTGADELASSDELDEMELSAVSEAMNQMMAAAAGATTEVLGTEVEISPPRTRVLRAGEPSGDLCPPTPHATSTGLSVLGEPARLVQLVPNSFTVRMSRALDDLGIVVDVRGGEAAEAPAGAPSLSGITMRLSAELGRAHMPAGRAVGLPPGSVVELDAEVDAPIELFVNGVRFATGTLLVTDDGDWAVQVTDLLSHASPPVPQAQGDPA